MKKAINLSVNGVSHTDEVEPRMLLVHYLRDVLGLTGTHVGCETSLCGACKEACPVDIDLPKLLTRVRAGQSEMKEERKETANA